MMRCNPWLVKLLAGMSLPYYPAIFHLNKWTLGDSASHFIWNCIIKQTSDTSKLEELSFVFSGEL